MRPVDTHATTATTGRRLRSGRKLPTCLAIGATLVAIGLGGWVWRLDAELGRRDAEIGRLVGEKLDLQRIGGQTRELQETVVALDSTTATQRVTIGRLIQLHGTATSELTTLREQLADADRRRLQAMAVVDRLVAERGGPQADRTAVTETPLREVDQLSAALQQALEDRTVTEFEVRALHAQTAALEGTIDGLNQELDATKEHFKAWVSGHYGALRAVLKTSGVRIEPMVRQAERKMAGEGGPFVPAPLRDDRSIPATLVPLPPELDEDVRSVDVMRELLVALPLGVPAPGAERRSGFGLRRDPFTGRRAMHTGQDFAPGPTGKAFATAPGVVVSAGREGAYGKMIEIDHGFGLATRYAHLSRIEVKPGDHVDLGKEIGVIGSTGRSTGRHLHYEVKVDGKAVDPADFLEARERLAHVLSED